MKKIFEYKNLLVGVIFSIVIISLTVGYAVFYRDLGLNGNITLSKLEPLNIVSINLDNTSLDNSLSAFGTLSLDDKDNIVLNYNFSVNNDTVQYQATYLVSIYNPNGSTMTFTGIDFNPVYEITNGNEDNTEVDINYYIDLHNSNNSVLPGGDIPGESTGVVAIVLSIRVSTTEDVTIGVSGEGEASGAAKNEGALTGTFVSNINSVDLSGDNTGVCFDVEVINTYDYTRNVTFSSSNSNFILTNSSGGAASFDIGAPDELDPSANDKTFNICMKLKGEPKFLSDNVNTSIVMKSEGLSNRNIKTLNVKVDKYEEPIVDNHAPEVGNVSFTVGNYNTSNNSLPINITWDLLNENENDTAVNNYYVALYDASNNNIIGNIMETGSGTTSYTYTLDNNTLASNESNMVTNNHNYYFRVYGMDDAGNVGTDNTTGSSACSGSNNCKSLKWKFNIDTSGLTNMSLSGGTTVYKGNTYSGTLTASTNYVLPETLTSVTMGGNNLASGNNGYTYNQANGTFSINVSITGDIVITGSATAGNPQQTCLIKGTKIKMADGTYKNIEDVRYDDLIVTFSYDLGREVFVYPIWIKEPSHTDHYQRTTFSDGSKLETFHNHGIFSLDLNKFVSVSDTNNFHIGTNVAKIVDGKITPVSVVNIETIYEDTTYYHVESTRYLNAITNDLITADGFVDLSNMYTFNSDLTWSSEKDFNLNSGNLFDYSELSLYFPKHLFDGLRLREAKFLVMNGTINVSEYVSSLSVAVVREVLHDVNGNNLWMVTTSDDLYNNFKGSYYTEGSYYTLPEPNEVSDKNFVGWYSTTDNKYYMPGDEIRVDYGLYFDAIWE